MPMSRVFMLIAVILFILAFVGEGAGLNGGRIYGQMNWSSLIALGLAFWSASSFV